MAEFLLQEILNGLNLILAEKEVLKMVKCAERSGAPLEILVTPQWFVKILDKKKQPPRLKASP